MAAVIYTTIVRWEFPTFSQGTKQWASNYGLWGERQRVYYLRRSSWEAIVDMRWEHHVSKSMGLTIPHPSLLPTRSYMRILKRPWWWSLPPTRPDFLPPFQLGWLATPRLKTAFHIGWDVLWPVTHSAYPAPSATWFPFLPSLSYPDHDIMWYVL